MTALYTPTARHDCHTNRDIMMVRDRLLPRSSVAVALGGLTLWHAALICRGETSVERHINRKESKRLKEQGKVQRSGGWGWAIMEKMISMIYLGIDIEIAFNKMITDINV